MPTSAMAVAVLAGLLATLLAGPLAGTGAPTAAATTTPAGAVTIPAAVSAGTVPAAMADDYWVVGGDQTGRRLTAYDPAVADWNTAQAVKWTWQPTVTPAGFSADEVSAFGLIADFKLRRRPSGAQSFVVAAGGSRGVAAVVSYPGGTRQWARVLPGNLHAAELLPDGNVAVAASTGGWVRVYASSQGPSAATYAEFRLPDAHAALWDPAVRRLWVIGRDPSPTTGTSSPRSRSRAPPPPRRCVRTPDAGPSCPRAAATTCTPTRSTRATSGSPPARPLTCTTRPRRPSPQPPQERTGTPSSPSAASRPARSSRRGPTPPSRRQERALPAPGAPTPWTSSRPP
ncbi:hypothetical protein AB0C27_43395 [Nonomuraea sp. NPDC048882]|uniref:hypothetical protein n=1 Tax=Nonomuraea sp. NPDC048882 TaxID=3154347 RepID=UPI0033C59EA4